MGTPLAIFWFRNDLRLADNPALQAAVEHGGAVLPVFIHAPEEEGDWPPGAASRWWLHQSLKALARGLAARGSRLILRRGDSLRTLAAVARESGATAVFWSRRYEPVIMERDQPIKEALSAAGLEVQSFNSLLLHEPGTIRNKTGGPYQVFTPFWKACQATAEPMVPLAAPISLAAPTKWPDSLTLEALALEPSIDWAVGMRAAWQPGEAGAQAALQQFLKEALANYDDERNLPAHAGTSRLSPHLHYGEISARQVWHEVRAHGRSANPSSTNWRGSQFLTELGWREFSHHLLHHFPRTITEPLRPEFVGFPWRNDAAWLSAWQRGRTGYPIVDAGMRELWATGWMHNRVRMIAASFLVKDLLIDWREGTRWFWDTLVDADLANNTLGWQWTAGCGADAAPYFRIFNPISQGREFDPDGDYVRRWVPELTGLPARWIHQPWEAPAPVLASANVKLGKNYPQPLVSHTIARNVALEAYHQVKRTRPANLG